MKERYKRTGILGVLAILVAALVPLPSTGIPGVPDVNDVGVGEVCTPLLPPLDDDLCLGGVLLCNEPGGERVCGFVFDPGMVADCQGKVSVQANQVAICGQSHGLPCGSGVDLNPSGGASICGVDVPAACDVTSSACALLDDCLTEPASTPCGIDPDDCQGKPMVCALIQDCLNGAAGLTSYGGGTVSVCGTDVDPCDVNLLCSLDCLHELGQWQAGDKAPCDVPVCQDAVLDLGTLEVCGVSLDPCANHLLICQNPCLEPALGALGAATFLNAHEENNNPSLQPQGTPPSEICGIPISDICDHLGGIAPPGGGVPTLDVSNGGTVMLLAHRLEGLFQAFAFEGCELQPCEPSNVPVRNLDCPCQSAPSTPLDWDGDQSLNNDDVDDDCDLLLDTLEHQVFTGLKFYENVYDDLMDLSPFSDLPVEIYLAFSGLRDVHDFDPGTGSTDPYLTEVYLCHTNSACPMDKPVEVPDFNKGDHPVDIGASHAWALGADDFAAATKSVIPLGTDRFDNLQVLGWRGSSGSVTEMPRIGANVRLIDEDGAFRWDDESLGTQTFNLGIIELSRLAGNAMNAGSDIPLVFSQNTKVDVQIGLSSSKCATDWAFQALNGNREIGSVQTRDGGSPSLSAC